jgi:hypothetical protein
MPRKTEGKEAGGEQIRLVAGVVPKPPVGAEDLKADTEQDPEAAKEFVALIRALRKEGSHAIALGWTPQRSRL